MRHFFLLCILVFSTYAESIEYFPVVFDKIFFPSQFFPFIEYNFKAYQAILKEHRKLTDERNPEFLEDLKRNAPWIYLYALEYDAYIKNEVAQLGPEARELVGAVFSDVRDLRAQELSGQELNKTAMEEMTNRIVDQFNALSTSARLEIMMHFDVIVGQIQDYIASQSQVKEWQPGPDVVDPFDRYIRSLTSSDRFYLKKFVNASVVEKESTFLTAVKEHVPQLFTKISEMKDKIVVQVEDLKEQEARYLVRKFYSLCFKQHRLNLFGIKPKENFDIVVKRLAKEFAALSHKSMADIIVKFPFVAEPLLGSLSHEQTRFLTV